MKHWPEQQYWPRLKWWYGLPVVASCYPVLSAFQQAVVKGSEQPQHALITAYAYPLLLGLMFAVTLAPRYWFGFVWFALMSYSVAVVSYVVASNEGLQLGLSLALLWSCQSLVLWLRRLRQVE